MARVIVALRWGWIGCPGVLSARIDQRGEFLSLAWRGLLGDGWTEIGAKYVGIMQSLIVTCRLHGIDPFDYLVDVLQRVGQHPPSRVHELTPRRWKPPFAADPLRSPLHTFRE